MHSMYIFRKGSYSFNNKYSSKNHPDGIEHDYEVYINGEILTDDKIIWYEKNSQHFHLGYIGFKDQFRHKGILKNYIHPHCISYLSKKNVKKITLKPLMTYFVLWVSLGFKLINTTEELEVKRLIKEYLIGKGVHIKEDFSSLSVQEIVRRYKNKLLSKDFPPYLEKLYYTNLIKEI